MKTKIGWCDHSINPGIFGCSPKGPECLHCYAAKMAHRQVAMGNYPEGITEKTAEGVKWTGKVILAPHAYMVEAFAKLPKKKRGRVFVTSMADLFHWQVNSTFILNAYKEMAARPHLTFMVLTKRPDRLLEFWLSLKAWDGGKYSELANVYYGITGGTQGTFNERWSFLRQVEAPRYFVSLEPLLSNVILPQNLLCLGDRVQVIWGGEQDANARVMKPEDARSIRDQLVYTGVKRYFKQWGTFLPTSQMIPGVHTNSMDLAPGSDDAFIKVSKYGGSDLLDGVTYHEHLELA